jgi:purine-nucleoside phosphorylase
MVYGEMGTEALKWASESVFGLNPAAMPPNVVVTPFKVEECFKDFRSTLAKNAIRYRKTGKSFLASKDGRQILFAEGGTGASNFADSSYILCHCKNVEKIVFVGTGGGISDQVKSADVNVPPFCMRLDKVLEILLPPEAPATADPFLAKALKRAVSEAVQDLNVAVHSGGHATVPFFLSETRQLLTDLQKQGVLSADMELSVLYALANHYHKKAAGIIRIGDLPLNGLPAWKSRTNKKKLKRQVHNGILKGIIAHFLA